MSAKAVTATEVVNEETGETFVMNEVQLLLAGKRTSLATLRTGITVFALPLSIVTALIATSRFYDVQVVLPLLVPLLVLCGLLLAIGSYLVGRALRRLHRYDRKIREIEERDALVRELIEEP